MSRDVRPMAASTSIWTARPGTAAASTSRRPTAAFEWVSPLSTMRTSKPAPRMATFVSTSRSPFRGPSADRSRPTSAAAVPHCASAHRTAASGLRRSSQVFLHPAEHGFMPRPAVERFEYPVALVGKYEGLAGHAIAPEHGEHLKTLIDRHAEIPVVGNDQGRRPDVVGKQMRRPFRELRSRLGRPRRPTELPVGKPYLLGGETHRLEVEHAVVSDGRLEPVRVPQDPVHRIAAEACARNAKPL